MKQIIITVLFFMFISGYTGIAYAQDKAEGDYGTQVVLGNDDILIYPNPVYENKFYVKSDKLIKKVEVINIIGQKIKIINNRTNIPYNILVETDDMKKGMYMVQVTLETGEKIINKILIK